MRFLLAAILFLAAVVVFTLIAKVVYQDSVETEFERQATASLEAAGFESVIVDFDHHDAKLLGFVDSHEEIKKAREVVQAALPLARLPEIELSEIAIRPSIPPILKIESISGGQEVEITGKLGEDGESVRVLFGSRLAAISGGSVSNAVEIDPMRLPLRHVAELAAVSVELARHSETATIAYEDNTLSLEGTVENDGIKEGILELAALVPETSLNDEVEVVDPSSFLRKSTLVLTRNRFGVTLGGVRAPEETVEVGVILSESSPAMKVTDRRTLDSERIPGSWEEHAAESLPALIDLMHGEMTLEFGEGQIRLTGVTASREKREQILAAIQPILNQNSEIEVLADLNIEDPDGAQGPPSLLSIKFEEGLLTLEGRLQDDSIAAELETALVDAIPDLLVKNAIQVEESAAPAPWLEALPLFLAEALARTEGGSFHFSDSKVRLEGTTREITDKAILQNVAVNSVPPGYSIENQLMHPDEAFPMPELLPEARAQLAESLKQFPIYFDTNSEIVNDTGREKVEAIAALLREAGVELDLVVTGFADNVGNASYNRELSLRRADSVVAALAALEIPEESMETKSEGEDVSGLSRSERWKARRVEVALAEETASPQESAE
ncbi:MAG: OmpA family protein [Verrucomicrobiota bacterium]